MIDLVDLSGSGPRAKTSEEMQALLQEALGDLVQEYTTVLRDELVALVPPNALLDTCRRAKSDPRLAFDYLRCLSGVDYPEYFEIVYHLVSMTHRHNIVLKVRVPKDSPVVDSVTSVWTGADWHEREAAEMFGLDFAGHPHLVPLLLEEGLDEHPLLKSTPLQPIREASRA